LILVYLSLIFPDLRGTV